MPKIFEFKLLLVYKLVDMSKIQNKPLLSLTKVRNWKRINDIGLTSRSIFSLKKRHWKFKEGNFVTLHNNIGDELQNFQSMPKIHKFSKSSMYRWISQINCSRVCIFEGIQHKKISKGGNARIRVSSTVLFRLHRQSNNFNTTRGKNYTWVVAVL